MAKKRFSSSKVAPRDPLPSSAKNAVLPTKSAAEAQADHDAYIASLRSSLRPTHSKFAPPPPPTDAPPPPPSAPPSGGGASGAAPNLRSREAELERLRSKGLAKIFNKHFTAAASTAAAEREKADAALREIEARKAELRGDASGDAAFAEAASAETLASMSALDREYANLKRRREECKRKERETLLLYRSYVTKYGESVRPGNLPPEKFVVQPTILRKSASGVGLNKMNKSPEGTEVFRQDDLMRLRGKELGACGELGAERMGKTIDGKVERHALKGGERLPSVATVGANRTLSKLDDEREWNEREFRKRQLTLTMRAAVSASDARASLSSTATASPVVSPAKPKSIKRVGSANQLWEEAPPLHEDDEEEQAWNVKDMGSAIEAGGLDTGAGADADVWQGKVGSNPVTVGQGAANANDDGLLSELDSESSMGSSSKPRDLAYPTISTDVMDKNDDEDSVMSGLTSLNSQTMTVAELRLEEFLKSETEAIKKMLESEASQGGSSNGLGKGSASLAETVQTQESSRAQQAAKEAEEMARMMEEAVAWADQAVADASQRPGAAADPSREGRIAMETETEKWVAYWSEEHKREYYHEVNSDQVEWILPGGIGDGADTSKLRRRAEGGGTLNQAADDDDETSVKVADYTKKRRGGAASSSNRSVGSHGSVSTSRSAATGPGDSSSRHFDHTAFAPDKGRSFRSRGGKERGRPGMRRTRSAEYREAMRKSRNRRRAAIVVSSAIVAGVGGAFYYKHDYDAKEAWNGMKEFVSGSRSGWKGVPAGASERRGTRASARLPSEEEEAAKAKRREEIRVAKEGEASARAAAAAKKKAMEEKAEAEAKQAEAKNKKEEEEAKKDAEVAAAADDLRTSKKQLEPLKSRAKLQNHQEEEKSISEFHRPIGCYIPFSHLFASVCRRKASERPVFDLQAFVDSMMQ